METKELISKAMSELAKIRHKKSPKPKEYYQKISREYWAKNKGKKKLLINKNNETNI